MTTTSMRELMEAAARTVEIHGDIFVLDAQERLNEVLVAAGLHSTGNDRITRLYVDGENVHVRHAWNAKGCDCDDAMEFPSWIIDADDPVRAAARWRLERSRAGIAKGIESARETIERCTASIPRMEAELARLDAELAGHG